jgi:hypothetical protein
LTRSGRRWRAEGALSDADLAFLPADGQSLADLRGGPLPGTLLGPGGDWEIAPQKRDRIAPNSSLGGRARNRRVEFLITYRTTLIR